MSPCCPRAIAPTSSNRDPCSRRRWLPEHAPFMCRYMEHAPPPCRVPGTSPYLTLSTPNSHPYRCCTSRDLSRQPTVSSQRPSNPSVLPSPSPNKFIPEVSRPPIVPTCSYRLSARLLAGWPQASSHKVSLGFQLQFVPGPSHVFCRHLSSPEVCM
ncbi:hypothetical protein LIA77_03073 [Sarocladium implicatum]|nr:hypothetical protein LIA77_03073 [Sarocladium implicatum]